MRTFIESFERAFAGLHERSCLLVVETSQEILFLRPSNRPEIYSFGELILRSAAKVEQTFGGITSRLWDDPFEWTLPEKMSNCEKILEYFDEVRETRIRGFDFLVSDEDLKRELPSPERMRTIFEVLLETIVDAEKFEASSRISRNLVSK